ncbi:N-acetylglucosamine repressor [Candidatus Phycosocius bacilliformis]|uniref:N-acetylglucosamine repressor n=1 Tax=Candidatus Phycosocius bacilliformis TaxID=1445552 RepID=A0A2P2EE45_9PROT|nr:ROK family transcriptional regulator [Candidatus Phycosocius bacilliformis]GBF59337.1 N-acetylglucosamine repressor [Candidatus Phycosocius bacilliformis]
MREILEPNHRFTLPSDSEMAILSHILRHKGSAQPDIVQATDLSQQTVSRLVNSLLDRGAVQLAGRIPNGRRGQPRLKLEIAPGYAYALGVALMTDAMSVVLMDFAGQVVDYQHIEMPKMTRPAVFSRLKDSVSTFLHRHPSAQDRLFGVGIGISGYCLDGRARYNPPAALDDWAKVDIDQLFTDALGLPAWVENDGNAAAIGESLLGVGRRYANFVYMFIAAGIGGGVISNQRLLRGVHGNGGEIGLMLPRNMFELPTLETLLASVRDHGIQVSSISEMLAQFDATWPGVDAWIGRAREPLSRIASSIAALLDPEAIVLGGRLPPELSAKIIPMIELYDDARREEPRPLPRLLVSETQVDACAIGAAMLPLEKQFFASMV